MINLKAPIVHMLLTNRIKCENQVAVLEFVKAIPDDSPSLHFMFENIISNDDAHLSGKFLTSVMESQNDVDSTVDDMRDAVLLREWSGSNDPNTFDPTKEAHTIMAKYKGPASIAAIVLYMTHYSEQQRHDVLVELQKNYITIYKMLRQNPLFAKLLNKDPQYYSKVGKSVWNGSAFKGSNTLAKGLLHKAGIGVLVAAGTAATVAAIVLTYKNLFSQAAKQCRGLGGKERTVCMLNAQIVACDSAIEKAKASLLNCESSKNEEKCRYEMRREVYNWTQKKQRYQQKLNRLNSVKKSAFPE